ncbi:TPA: 1,4-beta-cellobiosidase [Xanthomonas vasicola pv. zeae]|uniref:Glucanase n=2 Tax=Xanthomonas vasicola TaxID=56459 RepID=A0ABD7S941_XANVA|nr:glycoside hydrolase family 6 protein [Xanthomonas vasicola]AVQ05843.1 1,4-beta-cellobiosidase [Xanthomonas vasicola pv. vasculorum]AZM70042.1 1,4-beta-cellobiosidase [Xanthomonas vasicola pv. vasculorum]AZR24728.1 1,4-beta-cellobiosidase [Xanthomonas vasicola]KGR45247.1 1,4-beta-cellobiosidase [Xanthomonas vasicola]KGR47420.1 1,4-beta-cellobiosidase [Xanthomonas vasicola]
MSLPKSLRPCGAYKITVSLLTSALLIPIAAYAQTHVDNPFIGATGYANPDYAKEVDSSIAKVKDADLKAKMRVVKSYPTSVWLDSIDAIYGGSRNAGRLSLQGHLNAALAQKKANTPITVGLVIYDMPGRDCHALASNGELALTPAGLQRYKTEYIDVIAATLANPKYKDLRIVNIIEPDSLPNLVTNQSTPACGQAASTGIYEEGVKYALDKLHAIPNVYNYMDIGHSGWLGWDSNRGPAISLYTRVVQGTIAGLASADGFITNTANYTPLVEPNLPNPDLTVGGQPIRSAKFYQWNRFFDESTYAEALYNGFVAAGWPSKIGFLIDTGRNGWGGKGRPTSASGNDVNTYVDSGRVDKRLHQGNWCNQAGAGIGMPPTTAPGGHIHAYVVGKGPGESDGSSKYIPNKQNKGFDKYCDSTYTTPDGTLTGALPNAPIAGSWFHTQFVQLVTNAYPVIGTQTKTALQSASTGTATAGRPAATKGLTATGADGRVRLSWSSVPGATTYSVQRANEGGAPITVASGLTSPSYVDQALTNGTTYYYKVTADDASGTGAASITVSATPHR